MAEALYRSAAGAAGAGAESPPAGGDGAPAEGGPAGGGKDDVIDAEYTEGPKNT
jgi:hypothetical protein